MFSLIKGQGTPRTLTSNFLPEKSLKLRTLYLFKNILLEKEEEYFLKGIEFSGPGSLDNRRPREWVGNSAAH